MVRFELRGAVAEIVLARPEAANAISGEMLPALSTVICQARESAAHIVCLRALGKHFCAGADAAWMRDSAAQSADENRRQALLLAHVLRDFKNLPQPTLALVQGACYGGGIGLAAAADICLAADNARFCFAEVKLGLIPATISPYIIAAIGARQARRYFLDAAVFSAAEAQHLGLVHEVVGADALATATAAAIARLQTGGRTAQGMVKSLLAELENDAAAATPENTADWLARSRATEEAREGLAAFLEKRSPRWLNPPPDDD